MKILITGAAGYAGSVVHEHLNYLNFDVDGVDNNFYNQINALFYADILDPEFLAKIPHGYYDVVIHLAAIVGDGACDAAPILATRVNVEGTRILVQKCKEHGVKRFIFTSTASVYGFNDHICKETAPVNPMSLYARLKCDAEEFVLAERSADFHPVVLRLSTLFGLSPRMRFDLALNVMTARATYENHVEIHGGEQWRPFLAVRDLARVIIQFLQKPSWRHTIYNIGYHNYQFKTLKRYFRAVFPGVCIHTDLDKVDARSYRVDFSRFHDEFGGFEGTTITKGIHKMKAFLQRHKLDWRAPQYSNLKMVQQL